MAFRTRTAGGKPTPRPRPPAQSQLPLFGLPPERPLMCNLFFAVAPDAAARTQCARVLQSLRAGRIAVGKPLEAERLHVSLCSIGGFFDQIPREHLPTACAAAATVRMEPFTVTFDLLHSTTGHMLLRPSDGAAALHLLHEKLTEALVRAGMRRWLAWNFNPHVTLSYGACAVHERAVEPVSWTVRDFGLIESLYGRHRHIERGRWMLESGDPPIAPRRRPADAGRDAAW